MNWRLMIVCGLLILILTACQAQGDAVTAVPPLAPSPTAPPPPEGLPTSAATIAADQTTVVPAAEAAPFGYTHHHPDGNRFIAGQGALPQAVPLDIPLAGIPIWVVAVPLAEGALWGVVLEDGRTQAFQVVGDEVTPEAADPTVLGEVPPLLTMIDGRATFLAPPTSQPGQNHPVFLNSERDYAFSNADGQLSLIDKNARNLGNVAVTILPDGRFLTDEQSRLLVLSDPTTRYEHGVLGDDLEAASISLIETQPEVRTVLTIPIPEPRVVEGIAPIWTDWNGDGQREIIVTLSDAQNGAQIVVFDESGAQVAAGPAIGRGFRWRHQIAVAPFGPNGEMELVDVLTPHIGGVVEFYQWQGDTLQIVAQVPGYTSHVIGSRNLDMAAAGDFDGDGHVELLLPNQQRTELGGIRRTSDGAKAVWSVPIDGRLTTNIGAVTLGNGRILVGIGRNDGTLRIFNNS